MTILQTVRHEQPDTQALDVSPAGRGRAAPLDLQARRASTIEVRRTQLLDRLDAALDWKGAALIAGPGYGKTSLLTSFLASYAAPSVLIDLADHHGDAVTFTQQLLAEVEQQQPRLHHNDLLNRRDATAHDALMALSALTLAHRAATDGALLLAIDEFHLAHAGSELESCLNYLLRRLPPSWRIIIASQAEPSSPQLARMLQYGEIIAFGEEDLAFTLEETSQVLACDRPWPLAQEQAQRVHADSAGWPAGVAVMRRQLAPNDQAPPVLDLTTQRYFARAVLANVAPALREFMLRSAVLPFLDAGLCDAALAQTGSASQIAHLLRWHLFIARRPEPPNTYQYHRLFRAFLLAELATTAPAQEIRALRRRAAAYLVANGAIELAAEQLIDTADWAELAGLIRDEAATLVHSGQAATLLGWIERVPLEVRADSPWMLLYQGRCLRLLDIPVDLHAIQWRAQTLFEQQDELNGRALALLEEAKAARFRRAYSEAAQLCRAALAVVGDDSATRLEILAAMVLYQTKLGQLREAHALGQIVLELLPQLRQSSARTDHHAIIKRRIAMAYAYSGDFHRGLALLREACEIAESDQANLRTQMVTWYIRATIEIIRGDFDEGFAHLDQAEQLAVAGGLSVHVRRIQAARGEALVTLGRLDAAAEQFQRSGWLSDEWGDADYFYFRAGHYQKAIDLYECEITRAEAANDPVCRARAQALLGASLTLQGNRAAALPLLEQAMATYRELGFNSRVPGIGLYLADAAFAKGDTDTGRALLEEALALAHASGAYSFFALEPMLLGRSLARARALMIMPRYVAALFERWADLLANVAAKAPSEEGADQRWLLYRSLLETCRDPQIRADLARILAGSHLTADGLQALRSEYGLTWRELQIFVRYYLLGGDEASDTGNLRHRRLELARDLDVTEYTVRCHITTILSKLGLAGQHGLTVYRWAVARQII